MPAIAKEMDSSVHEPSTKIDDLPTIDRVQDLRMERRRFDSECSNDSGFEGLEHLEPLDFDDIQPFKSNDASADSLDDERLSKVTLFSVAVAIKRKLEGKPVVLPDPKNESRARKNWRKALALIRKPRVDPWSNFGLTSLPAEKAIRHRYNALTKTWTLDEVVVKMDANAFDRGAMRECFRMKKLSNFSHSQDWEKDSNNYVAKRYMSPDVERMTYYEDVKLQMDAKLWGEEFNRHNPPKKVDIIMMTVYEFPDREGRPLFHVEHYIGGDYIKYNSNSGFVDEKHCRRTPHAFSHFTFERSGHELIVVDVQGVGDLYTDPQIHTADGTEYGDGNLGTKGMALFFHSHRCNRICKSLGLTPFDLYDTEKDELESTASSRAVSIHASMTVLRGSEVKCHSPLDLEKADRYMELFRSRSYSIESGIGRSPLGRNFSGGSESADGSPPHLQQLRERLFSENSQCNSECRKRHNSECRMSRRRNHRYSTDSEGHEKDALSFQDIIKGKAKASSMACEIMGHPDPDESVLGQVHLQLAKYHEACRFTDDGTYDKNSGLFHLKVAAECNIVVALLSLAHMYCDLPHDILSDVIPPEEEERTKAQIGLEYMEKAAHSGERSAMVYVARAYDTGLNLPDPSLKSSSRALYWYECIENLDDEEGDGGGLDWGMDDPPYLLLARQAEIWLNGEAESKDPNKAGELYSKAADSAMACMKGKLANKYYMLAEEAWAQVEEEEE